MRWQEPLHHRRQAHFPVLVAAARLDYFRFGDRSETIRKTPGLGLIFFPSAACFMISGVVLFRLNS